MAPGRRVRHGQEGTANLSQGHRGRGDLGLGGQAGARSPQHRIPLCKASANTRLPSARRPERPRNLCSLLPLNMTATTGANIPNVFLKITAGYNYRLVIKLAHGRAYTKPAVKSEEGREPKLLVELRHGDILGFLQCAGVQRFMGEMYETDSGRSSHSSIIHLTVPPHSGQITATRMLQPELCAKPEQ